MVSDGSNGSSNKHIFRFWKFFKIVRLRYFLIFLLFLKNTPKKVLIFLWLLRTEPDNQSDIRFNFTSFCLLSSLDSTHIFCVRERLGSKFLTGNFEFFRIFSTFRTKAFSLYRVVALWKALYFIPICLIASVPLFFCRQLPFYKKTRNSYSSYIYSLSTK